MLKSIHTKRFDDLLRLFGYDKAKVVVEVERALGRKLQKPKAEPASQQPQLV